MMITNRRRDSGLAFSIHHQHKQAVTRMRHVLYGIPWLVMSYVNHAHGLSAALADSLAHLIEVLEARGCLMGS